MDAKILVVDDEPDVLELVQFNLAAAGYHVSTATGGVEALRKIRAFAPDLLILDLMLPELDGLELCKMLRKHPDTADLPIIMLTAKATELDRVVGLEVGANDYVTKPFSPRELVLRVQKQLQFQAKHQLPVKKLEFGQVVIELDRHVVTLEDKPIELTNTEFKLLVTLVERKGRVQSRDTLLKDVWEYESSVDSRTVDTHMRRLRQKLGASAKYLETVRGFGYRVLEKATV